MKKLMCLALGVVAACSVAFSQVNVNETINGNNIVGTVTNVNPNSTLALNTLVTFVSGGIQYNYRVVATPSTNPTQMLSDIANAIGNAFNAQNVSGTGIPGSNGRFGFNAGEYALSYESQVRVPFDLGLSVVLGAGAIGAVKTARRRKKEQELAV